MIVRAKHQCLTDSAEVPALEKVDPRRNSFVYCSLSVLLGCNSINGRNLLEPRTAYALAACRKGFHQEQQSQMAIGSMALFVSCPDSWKCL